MKRSLEIVYSIVFARPLFQKLFQYLYVLSLKGMGYLNYQNILVSGELNVIRSIKLRKNPIVFDVGAADNNQFLKELYVKYPGANVYSFEPSQSAYEKLVAERPNNQVNIYQYGLGEQNTKLRLYDYSSIHSSQHASLYQTRTSLSHRKKLSSHTITIKTLDSFVAKNNINEIDFLKIDVEGFEFSVLKGARKSISDGKIKYIQFEFNEMNVDSRVFLKDFIELLPNYKMYRLLPYSLVPIDPYKPWLSEIFSFQNILAVRKRK